MHLRHLPAELVDRVLEHLNPVDCISLSLSGICPVVPVLLKNRRAMDLACSKMSPGHFRHWIDRCIDQDRLRFLSLRKTDDLPLPVLTETILSVPNLEELYLDTSVSLEQPPSCSYPVNSFFFFCQSLFQFFKQQLMLDSPVVQGYCQLHPDSSDLFFQFPPTFRLPRLRKLVYKMSVPCDCGFETLRKFLHVCPQLEHLAICHRSSYAIVTVGQSPRTLVPGPQDGVPGEQRRLDSDLSDVESNLGDEEESGWSDNSIDSDENEFQDSRITP